MIGLFMELKHRMILSMIFTRQSRNAFSRPKNQI